MASTALKLFIKVLNNTKDPEDAALELSLSKIASKAVIDDISKNYNFYRIFITEKVLYSLQYVVN